MSKGVCMTCGGRCDPRALRCAKCRLPITEANRFKPVARTPDEWLTHLLAHTVRTPGGCLVVTIGAQHEGYRRIKVGSQMRLAHRFVVEQTIGRRLDRREVIDHQCHNADPSCAGGVTCPHRQCVDIVHLDITTIAENWRRADTWSRRRASA